MVAEDLAKTSTVCSTIVMHLQLTKKLETLVFAGISGQ